MRRARAPWSGIRARHGMAHTMARSHPIAGHFLVIRLGGVLFERLESNVMAALFGTAILETSIFKLIPTHSLNAVLWKEWTLSIMYEAFIGFGMWWRWRSRAVNPLKEGASVCLAGK